MRFDVFLRIANGENLFLFTTTWDDIFNGPRIGVFQEVFGWNNVSFAVHNA